MTKIDEPVGLPAFIAERNARFKREREEREAHLRAQGYRLISCVAVHDARDGTSLRCMWMGETESYRLVNPPQDYLAYGIGCVLIGPESKLVALGEQSRTAITEEPVLTVFKGTVPR